MLDAVVIGAGITGLVAAKKLADQGLDVEVLEARDRVGGRIENLYLDGQLIETAAQWVSPGHEEMLQLIEAAGLELIAPNDGALLVKAQGKVIHSELVGDIDHILTPFEIADLGQGVLRFKRLAERMSNDETWRQANEAWLNQPLKRWVKANLRTPAAQQDFTRLLNTAKNSDADQLRLAEALHDDVNSIDLESLFAATGQLKQRRVAGGMWQVADDLANQLDGRIRLNSVVKSISQKAGQVKIGLADGSEIAARAVLVTLPPWLAQDLDYQPPLPAWYGEVANRTSPGNVIKAFVIYDHPWWRDKGLSGQMSADDGLVQVSFDVSDSDAGVLMGFFEGNQAEEVSDWPVKKREQAFIDALASVFGEQARAPHKYIDRNWGQDEFAKGSHGAHFSPGIWTGNGQLLAQPQGRIFFAGAEYASKFNGYLEGGARSGAEAAQAIGKALS